MERAELEGDWFIMAVERALLIGIFDDHTWAENAIAQLRSADFSNDQIFYSSKASTENGGFMESLKNFFTGRQPASSSQVASDLSAMGLPDDEANYYAREYQIGHPVVAVYPGERSREAVEILRNNGAYNSYQSERSNVQGTGYNQSEGTTPAPGYEQTTANYAQAAGTAPVPHYEQPAGTAPVQPYEQPAGTAPVPPYEQPTVEQEGEEIRRMKLREERLGIEKESVPSGEVRLHKEIVEEQQNIVVPVTHEEVVIEGYRVSEGRVSDTPVGQEEVIRIPVSEEQVHVTKTPVEIGEVIIGKREVLGSQPISETVRHERARLEHEGHPDVHGNLSRDDIIDPDTTP
jgi:uncharacterized protein (TIGR02271 family)